MAKAAKVRAVEYRLLSRNRIKSGQDEEKEEKKAETATSRCHRRARGNDSSRSNRRLTAGIGSFQTHETQFRVNKMKA